MTEATPNLAMLLDPITAAEFFAAHWEHKALVRTGGGPGRYAGLASLDDVDAIFRHANVKPTDVRMVYTDEAGVRHERTVGARPTGGGLDAYRLVNRLYDAYHRGTSVLLLSLHDYLPPVARLRSALEAELHHRVCVNLYLTPRGARAFGAHFDTHDVLILQLDGCKDWRIWGPAFDLPLEEQKADIDPSRLGEPEHELRLAAGDLLYIPRGVAHEARTAEGFSSLHLTVALYTWTWRDLLHEAVDVAARGDVRLRRSLPVGFLADANSESVTAAGLAEAVAALAEAGAGARAVERIAGRLISQSAPTAGGQLRSIDALPELGLDTIVRRRHGMLCRVATQGGRAMISFPGNSVAAPAATRAAFEQVASATEPFRVRDLSGLGDASKPVLARRLVAEGVLEIVD